jgi:bifunctional non-homologous end joining protein LigD
MHRMSPGARIPGPRRKCRAGQEVVIGGWVQEGSHLRSLLVGVRRGAELHYVGRVGTGFGRETVQQVMPRVACGREPRQSLQRRGSATEATQHPLGAAAARRGDRIRRLDRRTEMFAKGPLRDCARTSRRRMSTPRHRSRPSALRSARARQQSDAHGNVVMGVTISHPDKVLWPKTAHQPAVSKIDLARYLEAVGRVDDAAHQRPAVLHRACAGWHQRRKFFQRHAMRGTRRCSSS